MRVKICGITNLEDALHAIACGADALGFVFYPKSPRYITPQKAREIVDALPPFVERVGLFVNETSEQINAQCSESGMSLAQLHFETDREFQKDLFLPSLPVVRVRSRDDVLAAQGVYCLVDAFVEAYGGTGKRIEPSWFEGVECSKMILAGGLSPENLESIMGMGFYGVDVSSGVEVSKGKKDAQKVACFISKAKNLQHSYDI